MGKSKTCFVCGKKINGSGYTVRTVCYASYDGLEIKPWDLSADFDSLIKNELEKIKKLSKKKMDSSMAKWWEFRFCGRCASKYRRNPLGLEKKKPAGKRKNG